MRERPGNAAALARELLNGGVSSRADLEGLSPDELASERAARVPDRAGNAWALAHSQQEPSGARA